MSEESLFDTHVHLDAEPFAGDPGSIVRQAAAGGVEEFLVPGVAREGWGRLLHLAKSMDGVFAAPGLHPQAASQWMQETEDELRDLTGNPRVVAIGEIGLDKTIEVSMAVQEGAFRGQLRLAVEANLPVLIHCRRATGRLFEVLREEDAGRVGGIFHAFSGSLETAWQAIELGFALGFGGPLTFPNSRKAPEVLAEIPPEAVVLETDAPDLAPHPHRGEPNRPAWLPLIAQKVAEVRGWSRDETARITTANARRILRLGER